MYFRKIIYSLFLLTAAINAQGTIIPLTQDGWVGGLSGNLGWDNYSVNATGSGNLDVDSRVEGFSFTISSRNGKFVEDNAVLGFDFQWEENSITLTPESIDGITDNNKKRLGFYRTVGAILHSFYWYRMGNLSGSICRIWKL